MATIENWFPTPIYIQDDLISVDEVNFLINYCYLIKEKIKSGGVKWNCDLYNTFDTYDLKKDEKFSNLINKVTAEVNEFKKIYTSNYNYLCNEAWINIYNKNQYQEFHYHPGMTFSAVYYLSAPEGSGNIVFNNPLHPDMLPVKNMDSDTIYNYVNCSYPAKENRLIIFRSFLQHMVAKGNNDKDRISIAFNF